MQLPREQRQPEARLAGRIPRKREGQLCPSLPFPPQPGISGSVWDSLVSCINFKCLKLELIQRQVVGIERKVEPVFMYGRAGGTGGVCSGREDTELLSSQIWRAVM